MPFDASLEEGDPLLIIFVESHMDTSNESTYSASSNAIQLRPSSALSSHSVTSDEIALITPPAELRLRTALPEPQNNVDTCQQAGQSASQAAREASQSASQSIQQAQQSASQAAQQASQSASQAIQQFSNQVQQSISAASRNITSAINSANSAIASAQSSASQAIAQANGSMSKAQDSASRAQSDASSAVLQAGAAVAAATGSAAAAGSSFLAQAAKATQSAQASVSAIAAGAASQVSQASQQVVASQVAAVTATQAALAIVGSIIFSTLLTMLVYFLVMRHKQKVKKRTRRNLQDQSHTLPKSPSKSEFYGSDAKFEESDQNAPTIVPSQPNPSQDSFSGVAPKSENMRELRASKVKTTTVPWNPSQPPIAPTLGSWLKLQDTVSPFGPIKLPSDPKSPLPLGGQLKSPLVGKPVRKPRSQSMSRDVSKPTSTAEPIAARQVELGTREPKLPILIDTTSSLPLRKAEPLSRPPALTRQPTLPFIDLPVERNLAVVKKVDIPQRKPSAPRFMDRSLPTRSPQIPQVIDQQKEPAATSNSAVVEQSTSIAKVPKYPLSPPRGQANGSNPAPRNPVTAPPAMDEYEAVVDGSYRESKASIWTDEVPDTGPLPSPSPELSRMMIPTPVNPVRNTREWIAAQDAARALRASSSSSSAPTVGPNEIFGDGRRPSYAASNNRLLLLLGEGGNNGNPRPAFLSAKRQTFGLPGNPRQGTAFPDRLKSIRPETAAAAYARNPGQGLNAFLPEGRRGSVLTRESSAASTATALSTPGVGKAM